ncbi:MAG: calcium-binding protein [Nocardioides sp.]
MKRIGPTSLAVALASAFVALAPETPAHAAAASCRGVRATIVGTSSNDVIHGTPRRDVIVGLGGNDRIYAGAGNDLVCGGDGSDAIHGGAGDDRLYGGKDLLRSIEEDTETERVGDTLVGGPGNDHLAPGADHRPADPDDIVTDVISWEDAARGVHVDLRTGKARGEGADTFSGGVFTVVGSAQGDVIEGTSRSDLIDTGAGRDVVRARGGDDVITVGTFPHPGKADSRIRAGAGDDTVYATQRNVRIWGGDGDDSISAGGTGAHLMGGPGKDYLQGSDNTVSGGPGDDHLIGFIGDEAAFDGGSGVDDIQLDSVLQGHRQAASTGTWDMTTGEVSFALDETTTRLSASHLEGGNLPGWGTAWSVTGTAGDDSVFGDANTVSPVAFYGLDGDDTFRGSDGDDLFDGGPGNDHSFGMWGGDDTCLSVEARDRDDCEHVG